ncbi:DUF2555 domain-containing protein [Kovacikia minuta]|uniref:DUF2555 domain-containing protein n=1 Tax=Kovacikia minuta TaxID=2931930 RepID=UPI0036F3E061
MWQRSPRAWKRTNRPDTFAELRDWHLLRAIAFQRPELAEPYFYLLDMEPFDEA